MGGGEELERAQEGLIRCTTDQVSIGERESSGAHRNIEQRSSRIVRENAAAEETRAFAECAQHRDHCASWNPLCCTRCAHRSPLYVRCSRAMSACAERKCEMTAVCIRRSPRECSERCRVRTAIERAFLCTKERSRQGDQPACCNFVFLPSSRFLFSAFAAKKNRRVCQAR